MQFDDGDVAVPYVRRIEVPRTETDDTTRAAVVDALCAKYGLNHKPRRGTLRFAHAPTNHGVRSFTFYTENNAGVRLS